MDREHLWLLYLVAIPIGYMIVDSFTERTA